MNMKKSLLIAALTLLVTASAGAYDFKVGGLCYNITGTDPNTVEVTFENEKAPRYTSLSGLLTIPSSVSNGGTTYNVTAIGKNAFSSCKNITKVTIPNTVKKICDNAFMYDSGITELALAGSIDTIGKNAFRSCKALSQLAIPEGITTIENSAFSECTSLASVYVFGETLTSLAQSVFSSCTSLATISFPNSLYIIGGNAFYKTAWLDNQPDGLVYVSKVAYSYKGEVPGGTNVSIKSGTKGIAEYCFWDGAGLASVTMPGSLLYIGQYAFYGCTGLKSVVVPNLVTEMGGSVFSGCTGLTSVTLSNSLTYISSNSFYNCSGLKSVTVPNTVTWIGNSAFEGCTGLTTLPISNSVETLWSSVYKGCTGLTKATLPNSVKEIKGWGIFSGCTGLTELTIPNSITTLSNASGEFASDCPNLKTLNIDNDLLAEIRRFYFVKDIVETVNLGNSVTTIPANAFKNCTALKKLTLPNNYSSIGNSAFEGCTQLEDVYSLRVKPITIDASVFSGVQVSGYCDLHVPEGSAGRYRAMDVWKDFYIIDEKAGPSGESGIKGDLDGDGAVDGKDVSILLDIVLSGD